MINNNKEKLINYSIFNLTKDILVFLKKLKIFKIHIVGHDFGAYVAGYFSILHPNYIKSLTIMSMPFEGVIKKKEKML